MLQLVEEWIKENIKVHLTRGNTVFLPKWIRMNNDIIPGHEAIISTHLGAIYIKRKLTESFENQIIISSNGALYIPAEIRRKVKIGYGTTFEVYTNHQKTLKLVPIKK